MKCIYLIQADKGRIPYDIGPGSDVLLLQWQNRFVPCKNSFHLPGSTWASGRNELYRRARKQGVYNYYIFMDDDLSLSFDLKMFEKALKKYRPRRAVPLLPKHPWNSTQKAMIDYVKYVDHAFMALRSDCSNLVLPYTCEYDKTCWWLSSEKMCELFWELWPRTTLRFNHFKCMNILSRPYPRKNYPGLPKNTTYAYKKRWWILLYALKKYHKKLNATSSN